MTAFDLTPAMPEFFLVVASLCLLVLGVFRDEEGGRIVTPLAVMTLTVSALLALVLDKTPQTAFGDHFVFDGYASFLKVVIYLATAGALMLVGSYLRDNGAERFEYSILALFGALGMGMMVSANSFLALYMALELQSLSMYVLAAFHRDTVRSSEAGLKFFVLGALASGMLLYGCSLVYGFTGTLQFTELAAIIAQPTDAGVMLPAGIVVGIVFLLAGLAFKLAAVPFHMWTPDVYEGAPTVVTAYIAAAPKIAAMGLMVRLLMQPFGDHVGDWQQVVIIVSVGSMLLGAFAAIGQSNIKRLMAYSGIGQIGYALIGLAAGTPAGASSVLVYMTIYVAMTLGTFACILMMRRQGRYIETIGDLAGLSQHRPLMALALAIMMFSLAGIPPLFGFFAKLQVFMAAIAVGLTPLAVIGVLASVVGAYYYLRIVKLMYFDPPAEPFDPVPNPGLVGVAAVTSALMILPVIVPGPLLTAANAAAAALAR